jgi:hypothetical protein
MNCIGTTILANCHDMGEDYFILQKLVDAKSIEGFPRAGFFIHPETLSYEVYIGDVRNGVASLISKNNVDPTDFPNAMRVGVNTEIKIRGWNC